MTGGRTRGGEQQVRARFHRSILHRIEKPQENLLFQTHNVKNGIDTCVLPWFQWSSAVLHLKYITGRWRERTTPGDPVSATAVSMVTICPPQRCWPVRGTGRGPERCLSACVSQPPLSHYSSRWLLVWCVTVVWLQLSCVVIQALLVEDTEKETSSPTGQFLVFINAIIQGTDVYWLNLLFLFAVLKYEPFVSGGWREQMIILDLCAGELTEMLRCS